MLSIFRGFEYKPVLCCRPLRAFFALPLDSIIVVFKCSKEHAEEHRGHNTPLFHTVCDIEEVCAFTTIHNSGSYSIIEFSYQIYKLSGHPILTKTFHNATVYRVEGPCQVHKGTVESHLLFTFLLYLSKGEDRVTRASGYHEHGIPL